jgi:opacity protein-like surface antigen
MRRLLLVTLAVMALASAAVAADRIVHYEHFTAVW